MEEKKIEKRGGWRGGGRPTKPDDEKRMSISISLPPDVISLIKTTTNSPSKLVEQLLRQHYGLEAK